MHTGKTSIVLLCMIATLTNARAGDTDAERLEKLRARLMSYRAPQAPDWARKSSFIVSEPAGDLYHGVGTRTLSTPVAQESSFNVLFAALMSAESRARNEVAKAVSAKVTQSETRSPGQQERSTKTQSTVTIGGVQMLEFYLTDDGKTLYALAQWRNDPKMAAATEKLNDQVRSYVRKNAERAAGKNEEVPPAAAANSAPADDLSACSTPWQPSAETFDERVAAVRPCFSRSDIDVSWGNAPRPWTTRKRWSQGKGAAKVYFAVGAARLKNAADPETRVSAWQRAHLNTSRRLPRNKWLGSRVVDLHYDGKKIWILVGSSARPKN